MTMTHTHILHVMIFRQVATEHHLFFDGYHHHFWVKFPHDSSRSSLAPGEETRMHVSTDSWVGGDFGFWWEPWWVHNKLWYGAPNFLFLWNKKFMVFVSKKWGVSVGVPGVPFFNVWEALEWFEENMSGNPHILLGGHAPPVIITMKRTKW